MSKIMDKYSIEICKVQCKDDIVYMYKILNDHSVIVYQPLIAYPDDISAIAAAISATCSAITSDGISRVISRIYHVCDYAIDKDLEKKMWDKLSIKPNM